MKTRGRYKLYATDNSIPVPKVSLWRVSQPSGDEGESLCESDDGTQNLAANLDKFHNDAFQSVCGKYFFESIKYVFVKIYCVL